MLLTTNKPQQNVYAKQIDTKILPLASGELIEAGEEENEETNTNIIQS